MSGGCIHRWRIPTPDDPFARRFARIDGTMWIEGNCLRCGEVRQFRLTPYDREELYASHRHP